MTKKSVHFAEGSWPKNLYILFLQKYFIQIPPVSLYSMAMTFFSHQTKARGFWQKMQSFLWQSLTNNSFLTFKGQKNRCRLIKNLVNYWISHKYLSFIRQNCIILQCNIVPCCLVWWMCSLINTSIMNGPRNQRHLKRNSPIISIFQAGVKL